MTTSKLAITVSALFLASVLGCSSSEQYAYSTMRVEKTCTKTKCDERAELDIQACNRCLEACINASYSCNASRACERSCSPSRACTDDERAKCVEEGYRVELPEAAPIVEAACIRYYDHLDRCRGETSADGSSKSKCAEIAKVTRAEAATSYDCLAAAPCNVHPSECVPPSTTFGDELCDGWGAKCGISACTKEERAMFNELGGWLRDDVLAGGRTCIAQDTCKDVEACLGAWLSVLL